MFDTPIKIVVVEICIVAVGLKRALQAVHAHTQQALAHVTRMQSPAPSP
jgi:hypothetical protein